MLKRKRPKGMLSKRNGRKTRVKVLMGRRKESRGR